MARLKLGAIAGLAACVALAVLADSFATPDEAQETTGEREFAAVVADLRGSVRVRPPGGAESHEAILGMKLRVGEVVEAEKDSSVTLFLAGGQLLEVLGGSRVRITRDLSAKNRAGDRLTRLSSSTLDVLERGVWILGDTQGSLLVGGMREGPARPAIEALSPRRELTFSPVFFYWSCPVGGEGKVRVVVARRDQIVWRSPEAAASLSVIRAADPALEPGAAHSWWLESIRTGERLTDPVEFRMAGPDEQAAMSEVDSVAGELAASEPRRRLAAFLACSYYREARAWSRLMVAAGGLSEADVLAERSRELARREMGLSSGGVSRLRTLLPGFHPPSARNR